MYKGMIFAVAVSLLAVSAVHAQSGGSQSQDFDSLLANVINFNGGAQDAGSDQFLTIGQNNVLHGEHAFEGAQHLSGFISETAWSNGNSAVMLTGQGAAVIGGQSQLVGGGVGPIAQIQGLGVGATQGIMKTGGIGNSTANHVVMLTQGQNAANLGGNLASTTNIIGVQDSFYNGAATSEGLVESSMSVITNQEQAIIP